MTEVAIPGEVVDGEIVDEKPELPHPVIIEWPPQGRSGALLGCLVSVFDAVTGTQIMTVTRFDAVLHADAERVITVDLVMFADEDGNPILDGLPHKRGGEVITGVFRAMVAEMRVREPATAAVPAALPEPGQPGQ